MYTADDTIVAIATPPGRGGIGVVRVSGPDALQVAQHLTGRRAPLAPRHATLARTVAAAGAADQVVLTYFQSPHSYTGEDVVEISAHGSPVLLRAIVRAAMDAGSRLAEPGEFTLRAYVHGRIDLVQAEAVRDLIDAVTPLQARAAFDQLEGTLTERIRVIDARLFDLAARLEASLDFPDEGYHFVNEDEAVRELGSIIEAISELLATAARGRMIREGVLVAIAGRPNAGKSSLFNQLAGVGTGDRRRAAGDHAGRADGDDRHRRRADDDRRYRRLSAASQSTRLKPKGSRARSRHARLPAWRSWCSIARPR